MGDVKNLRREDATEIIKKIVEDTDICLFTTDLVNLPLKTRPMSTQKVDEEGNLWFFSEKDSDKNEDIAKDDRVQLFYANRNSSEYLSLFGTATIIKDDAKARELWKTHVKIWFDKPEDPNLTIIKVVPKDGYYWDTKDGKLISLFKMVVSAITGNEMDGSIEGKIKV